MIPTWHGLKQVQSRHSEPSIGATSNRAQDCRHLCISSAEQSIKHQLFGVYSLIQQSDDCYCVLPLSPIVKREVSTLLSLLHLESFQQYPKHTRRNLLASHWFITLAYQFIGAHCISIQTFYTLLLFLII